jgi:hypothetical protein
LAGGDAAAGLTGGAAGAFACGDAAAGFTGGAAGAFACGDAAAGFTGGAAGAFACGGAAAAGGAAGDEVFGWDFDSAAAAGLPNPEGMGRPGGAAIPTMVLPKFGLSINFPVVGQVRVSGRCCFSQ